MAYSTIQKKHCKCNPLCTKYPTLSCYGYYYAHLPEDLKEKAGTRVKVAQKNKDRRNAIALKARQYQREINGENEQEIWYLLRRYEMKGVCSEPGCNESTNKDNDTYYRWSICHIVPKKLVPSTSINEHNWIELCWIHHQEFDNTFLRSKNLKCFEEAKRKFQLFKDLIPPEQLRKVNPYLL